MTRKCSLLLIVCLSLWLLQSCVSSRPAAHMIFYNNSDKEASVRLSIRKSNKNTPHKVILHTLHPGLQELEVGRFAKGPYSVTAEAINSNLVVTKAVALDTERWIILNYTSDDSLNIQKKYGYVDTTVLKKVDGRFTGIDIYSENRRPPSL